MTVIAYRGGIMAADTEAVVLDHLKLVNDRKIIKRRGCLIGIAGNRCPHLNLIMGWFFADGGVTGKYPAQADFNLLVANEAGLALWDHHGDWEPIGDEFFAIGSGKEVAIGAMAMGASAAQAAKIAIKWCPGVGGRVRSIRL